MLVRRAPSPDQVCSASGDKAPRGSIQCRHNAQTPLSIILLKSFTMRPDGVASTMGGMDLMAIQNLSVYQRF